MDLSSTVRFSGIPNNATLELVELPEEERKEGDGKVTVCLQLPGGQRLVDDFPPSTSLAEVLARWGGEVGSPGPGEETLVVYMQREVLGQESLTSTTLRTLGLATGKGLLRLLFKSPEAQGTQASVYDMKVTAKEPAAERTYLPMRREAATLPPSEKREEGGMEVDTGETLEEGVQEDSVMVQDKYGAQDLTVERAMLPPAAPSPPTVAPVVKLLDPDGALVFREEEGASLRYSAADVEDDFFEYSDRDVKSRMASLKADVKMMEEGDDLLTQQMRSAREEGQKLQLLNKYKGGLVRVRLPCRHIVQGEFPASATISTILCWLSPLLASPSPQAYLYTAPPHTRLHPDSSILDLGLFPAALLHYSCPDPPTSFLSQQTLASLSNFSGAQEVAREARRLAHRAHDGQQRAGQGATTGEPAARSGATGSGEQKMPKWFKTGK